MPRRCIGLNPSRRCDAQWIPCRAKAQRGDIFCGRHRDGLIGAVLALRGVYHEHFDIAFLSLIKRALRRWRARIAKQARSGEQAGQGSCSGGLAPAAHNEAARPSGAGKA